MRLSKTKASKKLRSSINVTERGTVYYNWTEKDKSYMKKKAALRERLYNIEGIIIECLEDPSYKQARDITDTVLSFYPEVMPKKIMRTIYEMVHIDKELVPEDYKEDMMLL